MEQVNKQNFVQKFISDASFVQSSTSISAANSRSEKLTNENESFNLGDVVDGIRAKTSNITSQAFQPSISDQVSYKNIDSFVQNILKSVSEYGANLLRNLNTRVNSFSNPFQNSNNFWFNFIPIEEVRDKNKINLEQQAQSMETRLRADRESTDRIQSNQSLDNEPSEDEKLSKLYAERQRAFLHEVENLIMYSREGKWMAADMRKRAEQLLKEGKENAAIALIKEAEETEKGAMKKEFDAERIADEELDIKKKSEIMGDKLNYDIGVLSSSIMNGSYSVGDALRGVEGEYKNRNYEKAKELLDKATKTSNQLKKEYDEIQKLKKKFEDGGYDNNSTKYMLGDSLKQNIARALGENDKLAELEKLTNQVTNLLNGSNDENKDFDKSFMQSLVDNTGISGTSTLNMKRESDYYYVTKQLPAAKESAKRARRYAELAKKQAEDALKYAELYKDNQEAQELSKKAKNEAIAADEFAKQAEETVARLASEIVN